MGSGKTSLGRQLGQRFDRAFLDLDAAIEERAGKSIPELFAERGEDEFGRIEEHAVRVALAAPDPTVIALGGGAVTSQETRRRIADHFVVLCEVDVDLAWRRARGTDRPLARDQQEFQRLYEARLPLYREVADTVANDPDAAALAAAGVTWERGGLDRLGELVPGAGQTALVADANVMGIYGARAQEALGARLQTTHELPAGEGAKDATVVARLWSELRLDRAGTVVALGGGCTTDVGGFAAATYLRGVPWVAVPTTLVGQVDASIGGKTGIDIPEGKNLVGAFHWPARVVLDEALLETLPERERRQGSAELVKTQLLAGRELDVRGAAAYKAALCLRDPYDRGDRRWLNLGHTFAHALEAACPEAVRRHQPERARDTDLRGGERARPDRALPAVEQRGRVHRVDPRRLRRRRRARPQPRRVDALQLRDPRRARAVPRPGGRG